MVDIYRFQPTDPHLPPSPGVPATATAVQGSVPLVTELRRALERDELCLHYQPIVEPVTGEIVGAEALVRWQHPERGLLGPGEFLETLTATELAPKLTDWVVDRAIEDCAGWPATWFVSINLSPRELVLGTHRDLRGRIAARCRAHGVAPHRVCLELTEQGLPDEARLVPLLADLAELGVQLAIDDFGDGSASLGRLRAMPVDTVKLDRSLLGDLSEPTTALTFRLNLELAHACGVRVIAEGVETPEQLAFLRDLGCEMAQGFHLARPMSAESLHVLAGSVLGSPTTSTHHLVLHDTEPEACEQLAAYVAQALHGQGCAVVVARTSRLRTLVEHLSAQGLRLEALRDQGRLVELDAEQLLEALLVDGWPDERLISGLVAEVFGRLAPGAGPVRIHSELAPLLWERGQVDAALELEAIWDRLEGLPPRVMTCAYPLAALAGTGGGRGFRELRDGHHRTAPSRGLLARAAGTNWAETALLQHELGMLHEECAPTVR